MAATAIKTLRFDEDILRRLLTFCEATGRTQRAVSDSAFEREIETAGPAAYLAMARLERKADGGEGDVPVAPLAALDSLTARHILDSYFPGGVAFWPAFRNAPRLYAWLVAQADAVANPQSVDVHDEEAMLRESNSIDVGRWRNKDITDAIDVLPALIERYPAAAEYFESIYGAVAGQGIKRLPRRGE